MSITKPIVASLAFLLALLAVVGIETNATPAARLAASVRVPAEWEPHDATWMQWPRSPEASYRPSFAGIINLLQEYERVNIAVSSRALRRRARRFLQDRDVPLDNVRFHIVWYDWAWMRDNGPVWVTKGNRLIAQDWVFDGWGGQVPYWDYDDTVPADIAQIAKTKHRSINFINEGGALEFNGSKTLLTTWPVIHNRNPNWSRSRMERKFRKKFGVTKVVWLEHVPASDIITGGHIDGIARFIDKDTVAVAQYLDQNDPDAWVYEEAAQIIEDAGFNVLRIAVPGNIIYRGEQMAANYVNWLVANDVVIITGFNNPSWDNAAKRRIEEFFPGREVKIVDCRELWYWGGGVHCVTNQQPAIN